MIRRLLRSALPLALVLGACDVGPDYQRPEVEMPVQFRATEATEAAAWPSDDWWRGFNSADLDALIEQARAQNFDIAAAIARVRQADAQVRIAGAPMLPTLNGTSSAGWEHVGINAGNTGGQVFKSNASVDIHDYSVGLSAAYQLD